MSLFFNTDIERELLANAQTRIQLCKLAAKASRDAIPNTDGPAVLTRAVLHLQQHASQLKRML